MKDNLHQRMEYDVTFKWVSRDNKRFTWYTELGSSAPALKVYATEFEFEIPVHNKYSNR